MGMFDDVTYIADCPFCGALLTGWQSKDGACGLQNLTPDQLWDQKPTGQPGIHFYNSCENCEAWIDIECKKRDRKKGA
ncbi:Uncharacterised protein [Mycobacteroides abscessus subsp. abscessus]|nr:Uncharacterised protein [Mycobacteroides abscessus subsp. abscessus]SIL07758.1 Uncharacterised protein [Mycobacteroides abscessus subsp. abscessus]SLK58437.1 Uncharacterised protein [Mycobacteroides abscessus subsp. abscessus]